MNRRRVRIAVYALAVILPGTREAKPLSPSCGPLREVASLEMTALAGGSRVSVPLTINGKPVNLLVDTGAGMSGLTGAAAAMLGIRPRDSEVARLVSGEGGASHRYYLADDFQLAGLTARRIPFTQRAAMDDTGLSGAIGPDLMLRYDVEMDFSGQRLRYFSQAHCPGHIVHWSTDAVTQVPMRITPRARDYPPPEVSPAVAGLSADFVALVTSFKSPILGTDIRAQVMLDGRAFIANIDTGQDVSTINSEAARDYFDVALDTLPPQAPGTQQAQPAQAAAGIESVTVTGLRQEHRFHSLTFGGVTVVNPLFALKPAPANAHTVGAPQSPDITIGMDVLRKLHLYFAFGERMLYVSTAASRAETQGK